MQWAGVALVFSGVAAEAWLEKKAKAKAKATPNGEVQRGKVKVKAR